MSQVKVLKVLKANDAKIGKHLSKGLDLAIKAERTLRDADRELTRAFFDESDFSNQDEATKGLKAVKKALDALKKL